MAPKKKITDKTPKIILEKVQKPMKPSPKVVIVKIESSVALAQLRAQSSCISPKHAKTPTKQTNSPDTAKKPVRKRTPVTKKYVNNTTEKHSVDDSATPQEQLHTPVTKKYVKKKAEKHSVDDSVTPHEQLHTPVTRKYAKKTAEKHSIEDSVTPQEQLHAPVTRKYVKKTAEKHSIEDSVTPQEQLHAPVTRKYVKKTAEKHSIEDSVTPQEQLHAPVTRKYVKKTAEKHSIEDSLTPQEQLHAPVTRKYVKKTAEKHSIDDSVTPQEQLHSPVTRKYVKKTAEKHSIEDSVTPQEQLHAPVTRKYVKKTAEKHSIEDSVTPQEQLHSPVTRKYVKKTAEKHSIEDSVTPQEQLHSPVTGKYVKKTAEKHSIDDSVTPQEQLHAPVTRKYVKKTAEKRSVDDSETVQEQLHSPVTGKYVKKTAEKHSIDDSVTPQEQLHTPVTRKYVNKTTEKRSVDDTETVQEQLKNIPGTESRTLLEVKKKPAHPATRAKNKRRWKKQRKLVKPANIRQEISTDNSSDNLSKEGLAASDGCENVAATKRPRGRPKGSTLAKSKILKAKEIKNTAPMLEKVLEFPSPPQPKSRPKSVISNKSNLTWTKDISTESSISSDTNTSVTVISNDCVRFNSKLDQLDNPDQLKVKNDNLKQLSLSEISRNESSSSDSDSSSSSSSSSSSDSELGGTNTIPELNLSTSSLTPKSPLSDAITDPCTYSSEHLNKLLENYKAEMGISGPLDDYVCTNSDVLKGADPYYDDVVNQCDNFDRNLEAMLQQTNNPEKSVERHRTADFTEQNESDNRSLTDSRWSSYEDNRSESSSPERYRLSQKSVQNDSEVKFAKPCLIRRVSAANSRDTSIHLPDKQLVSNINRVEASPTDSFKTFTSDDYNYLPFDRTHDDEDVMSLYAESISCMESSRLDSVASVSNVSQHDKYISKYSPTSWMSEKYIYEKEPDTKPKEISRACVSSSGFKDINIIAMKSVEESNPKLSVAVDSIKRSEAQISSQLPRPFPSQNLNPMRSSLYKGICFFYLANQCKNSSCRFPHLTIDPNLFRCRLTCLTEDKLIAEYLLMSRYDKLKRKLCIYFVEECKRRAATRILFMMAIDLGLGIVEIPEDLRVKVLETALLHLNTISLDACDDLLKFEYKGTMMCDALLSCVANSQNFSQFKLAFLNLADLICEQKRPVDIQVASSILERVCILPGEDDLARGMLTLMKNTDVSIFESSLAQSFEVQLSVIDSDVHEVYLLAKKAALESRLAQPDEMFPPTPLLKLRRAQNGPRQTSPDSTYVDNLPEPLPFLNSAPRRFFKPRLPLWRRSGYNTRGHSRRGQQNIRMPDRASQWWYVLHGH